MFTSPQERHGASGTFAYIVGIFSSFALHMALAAAALIVLEHSRATASEIVEVFSVTLEGGEKLGGINQIPSTDNAPAPKVSPVSGVERQEERKEVAPTAKEEPKEKPEPQVEDKTSEEKPTEETELPEMKQKELEEAMMLEEKHRKEEQLKKKKEEEEKKKDLQRKVEEERKIKQEKEEEEKKRVVEDEKKKKEREEKERIEQEKKDQARKDKEKKERDEKFRKAIESAQQRSEGTSKSDYKGESVNAGGQGWGAAALGGKGMGGGTVRPLEFVAYVNRLEQHIKGGWRWIKGGESRLQAVIAIRLAPSGVVQEASIARGSGSSQFDDSALRAVYKASPVPPPPESLYEQFRETRITFDSQE